MRHRLFGLYLFVAGLAWTIVGAQAWTRVANTTLHLPVSLPTFGFVTSNAFDGLTFNSPVAIRSPVGETNRLFVAEKTGRIIVVTNLASPTPTVFLDLTNRIYFPDEGGLLSFAFHPQFASNGYVFVYYTLKTNTAAGTGIHDRIARFTVDPQNPNRASAETEMPLITQFRHGSEHHGGDIHFGPDGYLYVSLGDESGSDDTYNRGQVVDKDFFAGILRIDVDKRPGSLPPNTHPAVTTNYAIPPDNPFVGATRFNELPVDPTKVRTEFWAKGLRNPWRMSFDPLTGDLYCGDVGQATLEEVNLITRGGNYGWPIREGSIEGPQTGSPVAGPHFTSIDPILEYYHSSGDALAASAVIGGVVYRGTRFAEISGNYVFADHVNGNIWAFQWDGSKAQNWRRLAGEPGLSAFGIDPSNGDVLMALFYGKILKRLVYSAKPTGTLPATLADTGVFQDLSTLAPNPGVVPYDVNVSFWSDHAVKQRWFSIPNTNRVITVLSNGAFAFPPGAIWVKQFDLEMTNQVASSQRRVETRLLIHNGPAYYGITYRWDDSQTNATLVPDEGLNEPFAIHDGGVVRTQVWHYPSRTECLVCHQPASPVLGFRADQLDRDLDYGDGIVTNQLRALAAAGYLNPSAPEWNNRPALAAADDPSSSLEFRMRSYLAVNCAQCHQPGGLGQNSFDARIETPTSEGNLIDGLLVSTSSDPQDRVIKRGDPAHSEILDRISTLSTERMPPLASSELDTSAIDLLTQWITTDLTTYETFSEWQVRWFGSSDSPNAAAEADPDGDGASNALEYLTGTNPTNSSDFWRTAVERSGTTIRILFNHLANRSFEVQFTSTPTDPKSWRHLDLPENRLRFPAVGYPAAISDSLVGTTARFYRVLVATP